MTLLESLVRNDDSVYNNHQVAEVVNELAAIQENCTFIGNGIKYTPEMVPIVRLEGVTESGKDVCCVDCKDFERLLSSNNMEITDAMSALIDQVDKDTDISGTCEFALVVNEEDVSTLYDRITEDPLKLNIRCEAAAQHVDLLNTVLENGWNIYLK